MHILVARLSSTKCLVIYRTDEMVGILILFLLLLMYCLLAQVISTLVIPYFIILSFFDFVFRKRISNTLKHHVLYS